jgi:mercuric ion transport protein
MCVACLALQNPNLNLRNFPKVFRATDFILLLTAYLGTARKVSQNGFQNMSDLKRHLDKVGVGGSLFAALCCLGFPALVSMLSAIGLGFLINDDILRPLLIVFLLVAILGLALGMRHHRNPWALIVGILSAVTAYGFIYISFNEVIAVLGIAGLVIASLLNVLLRQRQLKNRLK